jgi:hypothetical protein
MIGIIKKKGKNKLLVILDKTNNADVLGRMRKG